MAFGKSMQEMLAKVAESLGIKPTEARRLELVREKLAGEKQRYTDKIDDLKYEIRRLEELALKKKSEYDRTKGDGKRIVGREIEQALRERKMLREKEGLLFSRLDKVTLLLRKFELASPVEADSPVDLEEMADDAAEYMEDLIDAEKQATRATEDLAGLTYEEPERPAMDVEAEMANLESSGEEEFALSDDLLKDLTDLEDEKDDSEAEEKEKEE